MLILLCSNNLKTFFVGTINLKLLRILLYNYEMYYSQWQF